MNITLLIIIVWILLSCVSWVDAYIFERGINSKWSSAGVLVFFGIAFNAIMMLGLYFNKVTWN